MPTLIMSWSGITPLGDPTAVIEIANNPAGVMVPVEACGFRLERPGNLWPEAWEFLEGDGSGPVATTGSQVLSSSNPNIPTTELIEARGPVGACAGSGNFVFVTPLGALGIGLTFPTDFGAGSFVADFSSESDITWLDSAGMAIVVNPPSSSTPTATLPPEFFEDVPVVNGCFRDFEGNLFCPEDTDSSGQPASDSSSLAFLAALGRNAAVLPGVGVTDAIATPPQTVASGTPLEVLCPVELRLQARFVKAAGVPPGNVRYRFRFAHGPVSTTFSKDVVEDGETSVLHAVALPLPAPRSRPGGGGGAVGPATSEFAIFRPPVDPGIPTSPEGPGSLTIEPLPDNQHKGSVRVEVVNSTSGVIASGWAMYHVVCAPGSNMGTVTPGLVGPDVLTLQVALNRWLEEQELPPLRTDGRFAAETERVVRQFQRQVSVSEDGVVGPKTWRLLLSRVR